MVDPGTAVGIVSLGLQVLQGLVNFYSQFASFSTEITAVVQRVESLRMTLDALDGPVRKIERDDPISVAVRRCIDTCKSGIQDLETYRRNCGDAELEASTLEDKLRHVKKRLTFPFRKGTLEDIGKILDRFQSNLDTVILALQLHSMISYDEHAKERSNNLDHSLDLVQRRQVHELELLQTVDSAFKFQTQTNETGHARVHSSLDVINLQMDDVKNSQNEVVQKLQDLTIAMMRLHGQTPISPMLAKEACDSYMNLVPRISNIAQKSRDLKQISKYGNAVSCSCPPVKKSYRQIRPWWLASGFWRNSLSHCQHCPLFPVSQRSLTIGIQFTTCGIGIMYLVKASLTWSNRSISSQMTCWNVVSEMSPAFRLFNALKYLADGDSRHHAKRALVGVQRMVLRLFEENRAGLYDMLPNGQTLFHEVCSVVDCFARRKALTPSDIYECLKFWVHIEAPINEVGGYMNRTPLEDIIAVCDLLDDNTLVFRTISELLDLGGVWSVERVVSGTNFLASKELPGRLQQLLLVNDDYDVLHSYPLLRSILQRSTKGLQVSLRDLESFHQEVEKRSSLQGLLNMLAAWPEGLEIFISTWKGTQLFEIYGGNILISACWCVNDESLNLLLDAGCPIPKDAWEHASYFEEHLQAKTEPLIRALVQQMQSMASRCALSITPNISQLEHELYHRWRLSVHSADLLFEAGLRNVDITTPLGTALWYHASNPDLYCEGGLRQTQLIQWLVDKGASFHYRHPLYGTTPAQILAERISIQILFSKKQRSDVPHRRLLNSANLIHDRPEFMQLYQNIFASREKDACVCACSADGCNVIGSVIKVCIPACAGLGIRPERMLRMILDWIGLSIDADRHMIRAFVRLLTFERLGLTHTCHDHGHDDRGTGSCDPNPPLSELEISDIQYVERSDLSLLETLLVKFDKKSRGYRCVIWEFLDGYWETRMTRVLKGRLSSLGNEDDEARQIGVMMHDNSVVEPDVELEEGSWDWFEREVTLIMTGA